MKINRKIPSIIVILSLFCLLAASAVAAPKDNVSPDSRCSVCGMFVAKYRNWITQILHTDNSLQFFDGVKDMMVYYFNPTQYGAHSQEMIKEIWVKDYYDLKWMDGRSAYYVIGSDIYGPMGKEFIPFSSREAAESFLKDHKGEKILTFKEITNDLVQAMRSGMKMRHGK